MAKRTCSLEDCDEKYYGRGYCSPHYQSWKRHGDPLKGRFRPSRKCSLETCDRPILAKEFCSLHLARFNKTGDPQEHLPARVNPIVLDGDHKICSQCGEGKHVDEFPSSKLGALGRRADCKQCHAAGIRARYREDPAKYREVSRRSWAKLSPEERAARSRRHNLKKYGITQAEYEQILEEQGHACASCRRTDPGGKYWHIDHHHESGKLREILCGPCNVALGILEEDVERILGLAAYVRRHHPEGRLALDLLTTSQVAERAEDKGD